MKRSVIQPGYDLYISFQDNETHTIFFTNIQMFAHGTLFMTSLARL